MDASLEKEIDTSTRGRPICVGGFFYRDIDTHAKLLVDIERRTSDFATVMWTHNGLGYAGQFAFVLTSIGFRYVFFEDIDWIK